MGEVRKKIVLATGQEPINREISKRELYDIVGVAEDRESLSSIIGKTNPSIVLIGEGLPGRGSIPALLLDLSGRHPYTRFIYLAGEVPMSDVIRIEPIKMLARAGIYDIIHSGQIKKRELFDLLETPRSNSDISHLLIDDVEELGEVLINEPISEVKVEYSQPTTVQIADSGETKVIVVSSIKPGTGKSFLSVNIATAIAQYGINTASGNRPRVALIEADLQNLSIGTLLQVENDNSHLMKAMGLIKGIISTSGELHASPEEIQDVNVEIKKCFTPYYRVKNLEVLAGSHVKYKDVQQITGYNYSYLIDAIKPYFDVIIIDANSSIAHTTTFPILRKATSCYFILNLDFNNIRNNIRYQQDLEEMGVMTKVKYVLNEDLSESMDGERLEFTRGSLEDLGFKLEAAIPSIDKSVFNNRIFQGTPIVLDKEKGTESARQQLFKVANQVHPIMNYSESNGEELLKKKKLGFRR